MGGTDKYHRLATMKGILIPLLYHYYIGGIILVSYPYHLKAEKCRRNERGLHA